MPLSSAYIFTGLSRTANGKVSSLSSNFVFFARILSVFWNFKFSSFIFFSKQRLSFFFKCYTIVLQMVLINIQLLIKSFNCFKGFLVNKFFWHYPSLLVSPLLICLKTLMTWSLVKSYDASSTALDKDLGLLFFYLTYSSASHSLVSWVSIYFWRPKLFFRLSINISTFCTCDRTLSLTT